MSHASAVNSPADPARLNASREGSASKNPATKINSIESCPR